jgi:hypothetical protein
MRKLPLPVLAICLLALAPLRSVLAGDGLFPDIPKAKARFSEEQACVEPIDDMRRNHMEYILHQRDATVHEGIRTRQHSLVECINCHVSDAPDAPRYSSEQHFCNSCHTFASVRIDCFQCHADRPVKTGKTGKTGMSSDSGKQTRRQAETDSENIEQLQALVSGSSDNE